MDVKVKMMAAALAAGAVLLGAAGSAVADPNGAESKPCAPGQHGNPEPGFRPPACEPHHGEK